MSSQEEKQSVEVVELDEEITQHQPQEEPEPPATPEPFPLKPAARILQSHLTSAMGSLAIVVQNSGLNEDGQKEMWSDLMQVHNLLAEYVAAKFAKEAADKE